MISSSLKGTVATITTGAAVITAQPSVGTVSPTAVTAATPTVTKTATAAQIEATLSFQPAYVGSVTSETDVLVQLKANLFELDQLHARMKFMMAELTYLVKRS